MFILAGELLFGCFAHLSESDVTILSVVTSKRVLSLRQTLPLQLLKNNDLVHVHNTIQSLRHYLPTSQCSAMAMAIVIISFITPEAVANC